MEYSQPQKVRKIVIMLMRVEDSLLLVVDVQERLAPTMSEAREVITGCAKLVGVAQDLNVPVIITEQYPKGLGETMVDVRQVAGESAAYFSKTEFSCVKNQTILSELKRKNKRQIIIAGVELHICILQTAIELKSLGYDVFVVADACSSQDAFQHVLSYQRLLSAGVEVVSLAMVVYEWLEKAGTEQFKFISKKYL